MEKILLKTGSKAEEGPCLRARRKEAAGRDYSPLPNALQSFDPAFSDTEEEEVSSHEVPYRVYSLLNCYWEDPWLLAEFPDTDAGRTQGEAYARAGNGRFLVHGEILP